MKAIIAALAVAVLCMSHAANAEEKIGPNDVAEAVAVDVSPVEVPAVAPESADPGGITIQLPFYWDDLTNAGVSLLGIAWKFILSIGGAWILAKLVGKERAAVVKEALVENVDRTWDIMGRAMKHAAKDGKLDAGEREELRTHCKAGIVTVLKGAALKLFASYTAPKVNAMIASAVQKRKAIASVGK